MNLMNETYHSLNHSTSSAIFLKVMVWKYCVWFKKVGNHNCTWNLPLEIKGVRDVQFISFGCRASIKSQALSLILCILSEISVHWIESFTWLIMKGSIPGTSISEIPEMSLGRSASTDFWAQALIVFWSHLQMFMYSAEKTQGKSWMCYLCATQRVKN